MNIFLAQLDPIVPIIPDTKYWADFGLAGLVIAALMAFIIFIYKTHREERKEWRAEHKQIADTTNETTNKLTDTVGSLTTAIRDLSVQNQVNANRHFNQHS